MPKQSLPIPKLDTPKNLRGKARILHEVMTQRKWIEYCESNGKSYAGVNGRKIKEADYDVLRRLEAKLREYK